jgi:hypothetical protein
MEALFICLSVAFVAMAACNAYLAHVLFRLALLVKSEGVAEFKEAEKAEPKASPTVNEPKTEAEVNFVEVPLYR